VTADQPVYRKRHGARVAMLNTGAGRWARLDGQRGHDPRFARLKIELGADSAAAGIRTKNGTAVNSSAGFTAQHQASD